MRWPTYFRFLFFSIYIQLRARTSCIIFMCVCVQDHIIFEERVCIVNRAFYCVCVFIRATHTHARTIKKIRLARAPNKIIHHFLTCVRATLIYLKSKKYFQKKKLQIIFILNKCLFLKMFTRIFMRGFKAARLKIWVR